MILNRDGPIIGLADIQHYSDYQDQFADKINTFKNVALTVNKDGQNESS